MIPFNKPAVVGQEFSFLQQAVDRGQLSGDGLFTKRCSEQIVAMTGARAALLTHSCTAALEMAAILADLKPGDEVIMPSFTFVSTANAVALRGAVPVFVDIDQDSLNIDPDKTAAAVTSRTRAIFAVHYAGFPADMDRLAEIARAHDLLLVEDAAQALGSTYKGRLAGSLGDLAAFSFHETKNIISGEGGALTLNRGDLVERAEIIREKGTNRSRFLRGQVDKYTWVDIGSSFLPGELIAAFLYGQLDQAEMIQHRRLALFDHYATAFDDLEQSGRVGLPHAPADTTGNGHMFYLMMRDIDDRDGFIAHMRQAEIITPFHYVPLHSAPAGLRYGRSDAALPVTDDVSARLVRLPMYFGLGQDIDRVIFVARNYLMAKPAGATWHI
ncbi:dTDP-4-amino-4,6-dideoxygalactose transaminase [Cypionkella sinensis]|uniref:dTDP-4-amino-4,6-dideoxygalactose transaminase n=1 Tax=Cypionkella sinensis TaxID=1756043 RepID=A0ABV7IZH3_9RHOB